MIYFDNAATGGFKPYSVQEVVPAVIKYMCANPTRSGHKLAAAGGSAVYRARKLVKEVFGVNSIERVIFTKNCTEALNTAILGFLNEGDHVVATCAEHNSVLRPLNALASSGKITVDYVFPEKDAYNTQKSFISYADVKQYIRRNTALVITNQASNVNGSVTDVQSIGEGLKKDFPHIKYLVDGAQSGGHLHIDMARDKIDALCLAAHKGLGGIMGLGVLCLSDGFDVRPLTFGGTGTESFNLGQPEYYPERLESGTLNLPAIVALYEGLLHTKNNLDFTAEQLFKMTDTLISSLSGTDGVKVYSAPNPVGIVAFEIEGLNSEESSQILSEKYSVAVRGGFHCAPLMHKYLQTEDRGLIRISLAPQNTFREITAAVNAVREIADTVKANI